MPTPPNAGRLACRTISDVLVNVTAEAREYIDAHGGALYVNTRRVRCCGGGLTVLDAVTTPPDDVTEYQPAGAGIWYRPSAAGEPRELVVELRGMRRRPAAFWDGCAFKV